MPDTLSNDELRAIRDLDATRDLTDDGYYNCSEDRRALLAHIDALTAAVRALPRDRGDEKWDTVSRQAVLAILNGEPE